MSPIYHPHGRHGFALPVTLFAMVVIGAVVTGGFYLSLQEQRVSLSTDLGSRAFDIAEFGLNEARGTWKNSDLEPIATEDTFPPVTVNAGSRPLGSYRLRARRLATNLFLVTSEGTVTAGARSASRRLSVVVHTSAPAMPAPTAVAVYGGLTLGGNAQISGVEPSDCDTGVDVAGVTAYDSTKVDSGSRDRLSGNPPLSQNTALDTASLSSFGSVRLADLIASATKVYAPGESELNMGPVLTPDSSCDTSVRRNWGDPGGTGPCADEYPIIYAQGDLHLKTGKGQGILIVEGNLKASGNFAFYGVVIVKGGMETSGTGNHMEGSVIVHGNGMLDSESTTTGNSLVQYSKCRVENAFRAALRPRPLSSRSWIDLSAATAASAT